MNIMKKVLFSLLLVIVAFFGITCVFAETAPNTLKITNSSSKTPISFPETFYIKKTVDGKYVYCSEYDKLGPVSSITYTRKSEYTDPGVNYILQKGYEAKNKNDYFVVQTAYWIYLMDKGMMSNSSVVKTFKKNITNSSNSYAEKIKELVNEAKSLGNYNTDKPTISLDDSDVKFSLSDDGKYYVSDYIKVTNSEEDLDIYVPEGVTYVYNNNLFTLSVPVDYVSGDGYSFTVKVTTSKKIYSSYKYTPSNSKYQVISATYQTSATASDSKQIDLILNKTVISKQDVTTKTELPGATLEIKNSNNETVEKWVSEATPHEVTLSPGTYTLIETMAPEGYELSTEEVEFTVNANGTAKKVIMYNTPIKKESRVSISKLDADSKDFVAGATLEIRDENGNVVKTFTSGTNAYVITGLKPGKYVLVETSAPEGYELSKESKKFTILDNSDELVEVVMYNKKQPEKGEEVAVPATGKRSTVISSLIGFIVLSVGSVLITKKIKKNEI